MIRKCSFCFVSLIFFLQFHVESADRSRPKRHTPKTYNTIELASLVGLSDPNHFEHTLDTLLVERVPGTVTHSMAKKFIKDSMAELGWTVTSDQFNDTTPNLGTLPFENIIATLNPNAERFLVLSAHYDSKYFENDYFVAATDSAVSCAQLINLAYTLKDLLDTIKNEDSLSLMFVFFDGEEAFHEWSDTDSLYGSRHLAAKWEHTPWPPGNTEGKTMLQAIDLFVLLDLLGAAQPVFNSYYGETDHLQKVLAETEHSLSNMKVFERYQAPYFKIMRGTSGLLDDHLPFLERGVRILHVIPFPFPAVWHTPMDNKDAVDFATVENLNKIFRAFVASYLRL